MVKKGLSLEQKREIILDIFHENDDVYQLKEIEKIASARGVTQQSIKDVVQSLVDDDLVHQVCTCSNVAQHCLATYYPSTCTCINRHCSTLHMHVKVPPNRLRACC